MLSGYFENCYGLKHFNLPNINFSSCNKALIYAPNGVMKSSLSKVFDDISKGSTTSDRIFQNVISSYSITHYTSQYVFNSSNAILPTATDRVYVVNTFNNSFEFTKETVSTLLADETTRNEFNVLMARLSVTVHQIEEKLRLLTGLTRPNIKKKIIADLGMDGTSEWTDIFEKINEIYSSREVLNFLNDCTYAELFNDKTMDIYKNPEFVNSVDEYIENLDTLLENNPILNNRFTDRNAELLGKELEKNNLFNAQHTIRLKDGITVIHSIEEWNDAVKEQLDRVYSAPELSTVFQRLKRILTANAEVTRLRDIIIAHREIIPTLKDINELKKQTWLDCFSKLDAPFSEFYDIISEYTARVRELYEQASAQSERWQAVVNEFNRRFRVPFKVQIENKANFLLKDEAPNLTFKYTRGSVNQQSTILKKDELMVSLSTGEKRALYLLYILFDLERIRQQANAGCGQFLIVADDIADSFDYKNKYAIIEYLNDLGNISGIDLLILTHNFDFYRTVKLRLNVARNNCYIAQRDEEGIVSVTEFKYQKDFFKNVVIAGIKDGNIINDNKKKLLISSIPFYRNLCEYSGKDIEYSKLTCFLHLKTEPFDTSTVKISDLWNLISPFLNNTTFSGKDGNYFSSVIRIANACVKDNTNEVLLENKLVIAIAIRLLTERFMKKTLISNGQMCSDADCNQTREWFNKVKMFLTPSQVSVIEEVNLITPESIHLNSFMFEPLIDISDWTLKELYNRVKKL